MSEQPITGYSADTVNDVLAAMRFNEDGLIPVIAQQHDTGDVLMMAWMNSDALRETLMTTRVCYWSRSLSALWRKGETSGQVQQLVDLRWDCDADTILVLVEQTGVACHTGRRSCFFNGIRNDERVTLSDIEIEPEKLYGSTDESDG